MLFRSVEGPAGVGKTELAKSVAAWMKLPLIRMQCYEGLDESKALYEWKYGKQLLYTQILKDKISSVIGESDNLATSLDKLHAFGDIFFSKQFLEPRPLLRALEEPGGAVLLIDEIDKSDQEFEAFLLEILSDFQVTIPEIGTVGAIVPPIVLLTSNSTRDLGDALKRRCLHLHIGFPDEKLEAKIISSRVPGIDASLLKQLVSFVQQLRALDLKKVPSVSETIDWAKVLVLLHTSVLSVDLVRDTLNDGTFFRSSTRNCCTKLTSCFNSLPSIPGTREAMMRASSFSSGKPMCRCRQRRFSASPRSRVEFDVSSTIGGVIAPTVPISGMVT